MNSELSLYGDLLGEIKTRLRQAQIRAAQAANAELVRLYWDIGRLIAARQQQEGWGTGVIPRLSRDLRNELPEIKGFSERNIGRMLRFAREYPDLFPIWQPPVAKLESDTAASAILPGSLAKLEPDLATISILPVPLAKLETDPIGQPSVAQIETGAIVPGPLAQLEAETFSQPVFAKIPWAHNVLLMEGIQEIPIRIWYAEKSIKQGWGYDTLANMIRTRLHERQGGAVTNFATTLPSPQSDLANELIKNTFLFDFLTLEEPFHERELETGLVRHVEKFLLELGRGFAFVGRQYPLSVAEDDYYLDLLFYHLELRAFVVIDLKRGKFKPEYAGKMNFYCSVVDDRLRHEHDQPTIGLILCQHKDRILAEYALRGIQKPIGVADYELTRALPAELASSLPSIEEIEAELQNELDKDRKAAEERA